MSSLHPRFKAAAIQQAPVFLDLDATVDKTCALMAEAADNGAELIGFPETWLPGYPFWIWLGPPLWGMQFVQRYNDNSLTVDSPQFRKLQQAARKNKIHASIGCSLKQDGTLYIAQVQLDDAGEVINIRRKLKPTHVERSVFGEGDGTDMVVLPTRLGRIGALNCWEHLQPLNRYALFAQNEQIHMAAWPAFSVYLDMAYALGPQVNCAATMTYAAEGQCFVIASTMVITDALHDVLGASPEQRQMLRTGGGYSMIYGPDGRPLAAPLAPDEQGIIYADIDLGLISLAKAAGDPAGHYARPDVTQLLFNPHPRRAMEIARAPASHETMPVTPSEA
jgi:nitrilase